MRAKPKRVAITICGNSNYGREAVRGMIEYCVGNCNWEVHYEGMGDSRGLARTMQAIMEWDAEGLILQAICPELIKLLRARKKPAVVINGAIIEGLASVCPDNVRVGRIVAAHFLERGLRNLGFWGVAGANDSLKRFEGFSAQARGAGAKVGACFIESIRDKKRTWTDDVVALGRWLKSLPKPVGVMCCHDYAAMNLTWVCSRLGLAIPQHVAVVGVGNDDIESAISRTPLSSVVLPARQIGRQAAALLDNMLKGAQGPREPVLLEPIALITRHSSDVCVFENQQVSSALQYIRDHACEPIDVSDIVAKVSMSRRSLERAFVKAIKLTPREQIFRVRIEKAKSLLAETGLKIEVVAMECGFQRQQTFARLFKLATNKTPQQYRQELCGVGVGTRSVPGPVPAGTPAAIA